MSCPPNDELPVGYWRQAHIWPKVDRSSRQQRGIHATCSIGVWARYVPSYVVNECWAVYLFISTYVSWRRDGNIRARILWPGLRPFWFCQPSFTDKSAYLQIISDNMQSQQIWRSFSLQMRSLASWSQWLVPRRSPKH
jgi:hypothetical protein